MAWRRRECEERRESEENRLVLLRMGTVAHWMLGMGGWVLLGGWME